jgi:formylglycine-generating enzyme required for sulfatase activity
VGSKKPNDWGLFAMHGNIRNWCQEGGKSYPAAKQGKALDDVEGSLIIISTVSRVWRGGSFSSHASSIGSAIRSGYVPSNRGDKVGFRPARTLTP